MCCRKSRGGRYGDEERAQPDASANVGAAHRHGTSLTLGGRKSLLKAPAGVSFPHCGGFEPPVGSDSLSGTIHDFITDYHGTSEGDSIDLTHLLSGLAAGTDPVADGYVRLVQDGSNTANMDLQVDANGSGDSFQTVAVLDNYSAAFTGTEAVKILYNDASGPHQEVISSNGAHVV